MTCPCVLVGLGEIQLTIVWLIAIFAMSAYYYWIACVGKQMLHIIYCIWGRIAFCLLDCNIRKKCCIFLIGLRQFGKDVAYVYRFGKRLWENVAYEYLLVISSLLRCEECEI